MLRVIGIDPGLTRCGVGIVDVAPNRSATLVHVGVIRSAPELPLAERLLLVADGIRSAVQSFSPQVLAVERVFAQHNTSTVMGTAQASGVALLVGAEFGLPAALHTPTEVKAAITGHGGADKKQVQAMVARILRLDELPRPADAADALALALCHAWRGAPAAGAAGAAGAQGAAGTLRRGSAPAAASQGARETPAMRAWREAEQAAARPKTQAPPPLQAKPPAHRPRTVRVAR